MLPLLQTSTHSYFHAPYFMARFIAVVVVSEQCPVFAPVDHRVLGERRVVHSGTTPGFKNFFFFLDRSAANSGGSFWYPYSETVSCCCASRLGS